MERGREQGRQEEETNEGERKRNSKASVLVGYCLFLLSDKSDGSSGPSCSSSPPHTMNIVLHTIDTCSKYTTGVH